MQRIPVGLGVDSDRGDAQFLARVDHAQGDFTTVGDEDFSKHFRPVEDRRQAAYFFFPVGRSANSSPYSTGWAASKRARQINEDHKIEFNQAVEMVATKTETEGEEIDVNPDQLRISLEFEKRPKPTDVAIDELMADKLNWRYKEPEAIVVLKEEDAPAEEEVQEEE